MTSRALNENPIISKEYSRISILDDGDVTEMSKKESFNYLRKLFKESYSGGDRRCQEEMKKIRSFLYTKAWIISTFVYINRIVKSFKGSSNIWIAYREKDEHENVNLKFVD